MRLLYGHDALVARFVQSLCERPPDFGECKTIGVVDAQGRLLGGAVFSDWDQEAGTIEMTTAAVTPRWLGREMIQAIGEYVFDVAGCQALITRYPAGARRGRIMRALGAEEYRVPRLYGRDRAGVFGVITAEAWAESRFNRKRQEHGQQAEGTGTA